jgi:hypothetical protein
MSVYDAVTVDIKPARGLKTWVVTPWVREIAEDPGMNIPSGLDEEVVFGPINEPPICCAASTVEIPFSEGVHFCEHCAHVWWP